MGPSFGVATFTANSDESGEFGMGGIRSVGVTITRTAGSTDTVDIDLYGSMDGTNFYKVADLTTSVAGGGAYTAAVDKPMNVAKIVCVTVGSGNTLVARFIALY